jgi:heme o synthase
MASNILSLVKFLLSLAIAFSTLAGYLIFRGSFTFEALLPVTGVFLLSCGAAALNQFQERKIDARMDRTRNRPLPAGRVKPVTAVIIAVSCSLTGTLVLGFSGGWFAAALGVFNLAWYNGVYTPLKQRSYTAVAAGALNGAVPPVIGWIAAGGMISDPKILFIAFFIFMWQIPHFWLLLMQYGKDYQDAGFYSITTHLTPVVMQRIILVWVLATSISTLFLPFFGVIRSVPVIITLITVNCLLLTFFFILFTTKKDQPDYRLAFIGFNVFMILVFAVLITEALLY